MAGMGRRSRSPRLVGRDAALADLLEAVNGHDPDRPVILLAGEAGIGKTRLLAELVDRLGAEGTPAARPMAVVRGSCIRLAEGDLPFAPVLEILDRLRDGGSSSGVEDLRTRLAGSGPDGVQSAEARTLRFIEIHDTLRAAAGNGPLAVVIDDLHWADRSTLDLILFLARRLRGSEVVLVAAYRSDELHRRHPLRPVVAELSRGFVRERVELGPLEPAAVVEQIGELGGETSPEVVRAIVERADGNPFYVEELVALAPDPGTLPESVRDVLLARFAALDPTTVRVLAACAIVGHEVDAELVTDVLRLDPVPVSDSLRAAVDHSILVPAADGRSYRFRHALLEEAIQDDLLPGDRVDLHRRVAASLVALGRAEGGEGVCSAELARHFDLGGQHSAAIEQYLDAATVAFRAFAWAEGVDAFERAVALDAGQGGGDTNPAIRDVIRAAANAMNWAGSPSRGIALLREWIPRMEEAAENEAAAGMWVTLSRILNDVGDEAGSRAALRDALRLWPADESTALGVDLLVAMSADAWIPGMTGEGLRFAERAIDGAERFEDPQLLFRALVHHGVALISLGDVDRGMADVDRAKALQAKHGWLDIYGILATNVAIALADVGELDRSLEHWQLGLRMSAELGIQASWDPWNLPGLALVALHRGRWSDADAPIATARAHQARGMPATFNENVAALLAAGRGDLESADRSIAIAEANAADLNGDWPAILHHTRAAREDAADNPIARLDELDIARRSLEDLETYVFRSRLAAETAAAAADIIATLHPRRDARQIDDLRDRARAAADLAADVDAGRVVAGSVSVPWTRANVPLAREESARAEGHDDPASWSAIAAAFADFGLMPVAAYATFRAAAAALRAGDRDGAGAYLSEAGVAAATIGMVVLGRRIEALARAGRLDLDAAPTVPAAETARSRDAWGLSAREREVLALLADGRTNGEIGAALFISTKTASVHVTHILDKLGVSTRTEAALLASRAGLIALPESMATS
jgi:DNA-binding NarL/FixJ family response regulator